MRCPALELGESLVKVLEAGLAAGGVFDGHVQTQGVAVGAMRVVGGGVADAGRAGQRVEDVVFDSRLGVIVGAKGGYRLSVDPFKDGAIAEVALLGLDACGQRPRR